MYQFSTRARRGIFQEPWGGLPRTVYSTPMVSWGGGRGAQMCFQIQDTEPEGGKLRAGEAVGEGAEKGLEELCTLTQMGVWHGWITFIEPSNAIVALLLSHQAGHLRCQLWTKSHWRWFCLFKAVNSGIDGFQSWLHIESSKC